MSYALDSFVAPTWLQLAVYFAVINSFVLFQILVAWLWGGTQYLGETLIKQVAVGLPVMLIWLPALTAKDLSTAQFVIAALGALTAGVTVYGLVYRLPIIGDRLRAHNLEMAEQHKHSRRIKREGTA